MGIGSYHTFLCPVSMDANQTTGYRIRHHPVKVTPQDCKDWPGDKIEPLLVLRKEGSPDAKLSYDSKDWRGKGGERAMLKFIKTYFKD